MLSRLFHAVSRWLAAPGELPRQEWLRRGLPVAVVAVMVGVAPFLASGAVRAVTGWTMPVALAVAIVLTAIATLPFWPSLRAMRLRRRRLTAAVFAAAAGWTMLLLYNHYFGGIMVIVDGDSGTHVALRNQFVTSNPSEYAGFVSFYAATWWFERVIHHTFVSFAVAYFASAVTFAVAPLVAASSLLADGDDARWRRGAATALAATLATLVFVTLPLIHYHQAEGFFAHIFGLAPLVCLWLIDGFVRPPRLRLAALATGVVAYRYTYGLNLGDMFVALALLVGLDARRAGAGLASRAVLFVAAAAMLVAARTCYQRLEPLWSLDGWIIAHDVGKALTAEWLLVAAQTLALVLPWTRARLAGTGITRWLRLPLAFGTVNAVVVSWMVLHPPPTRYYFMKYDLHALLLLVASAIVLATALVAGPAQAVARARGRGDRVAGPLIGVALAAACALAAAANRPYWPGFVERAFGRPPFRILHPLADLRAWHRIRRILAHEHKQFGGYVTTFYPVMNFMNASFGYPNGGIHFYYGRPAIEAPGYCDFWEGGSPSSWLEADFPQRGTRDRWSIDPHKQCVSYPQHWNPDVIRTLCWVCR